MSDTNCNNCETGCPRTADELVLFADNDYDLDLRSARPIRLNLLRKIVKGVYQHALAEKLWLYHANRAAQKYEKDFGEGTTWQRVWHRAWPMAVRKEAAKLFAREFKDLADDGEWSDFYEAKTGKECPEILKSK